MITITPFSSLKLTASKKLLIKFCIIIKQLQNNYQYKNYQYKNYTTEMVIIQTAPESIYSYLRRDYPVY